MKKIKGFTLIELLVVIAIIGILAAMGVVSFTAIQKQARDTARRSDLAQYRTEIEAYANKSSGFFPLLTSAKDASDTLCTILNTSLNQSGACPEDPKFAADNTYPRYQYESNDTATEYVLWAKLENATDQYWVVCSSGQSGKIATSTEFINGSCPSGLIP